MNLTGKHLPGVQYSGGNINSLNRRAPIETHLPLPDLACCIVRLWPDSVRGRTLCRRDVWKGLFLLSRIASSEMLYVSSYEHNCPRHVLSEPSGRAQAERKQGKGCCGFIAYDDTNGRLKVWVLVRRPGSAPYLAFRSVIYRHCGEDATALANQLPERS